MIALWPEALFGEAAPAEAFLDPAELGRVQDFLTTVAEAERLTGLDLGAALRAADIRAGEAGRAVASEAELPRAARPREPGPPPVSGRPRRRPREARP